MVLQGLYGIERIEDDSEPHPDAKAVVDIDAVWLLQQARLAHANKSGLSRVGGVVVRALDKECTFKTAKVVPS